MRDNNNKILNLRSLKCLFGVSLILFTIFNIVLFVSCESPKSNLRPLTRDEVISLSNNQKETPSNIQYKEVGDEWSISLEENLTTGYEWNVSFSGDGEIEIINDEFVSPITPDDFVGAPGSHVWSFKATKPGTVAMHLLYLRPWDKTDIADRRTYMYTIR